MGPYRSSAPDEGPMPPFRFDHADGGRVRQSVDDFEIGPDVVVPGIGEQRTDRTTLALRFVREMGQEDAKPSFGPQATSHGAGTVALGTRCRLGPRENHHVGRRDGKDPPGTDRCDRDGDERHRRAVRVEVDVIERCSGRRNPRISLERRGAREASDVLAEDPGRLGVRFREGERAEDPGFPK